MIVVLIYALEGVLLVHIVIAVQSNVLVNPADLDLFVKLPYAIRLGACMENVLQNTLADHYRLQVKLVCVKNLGPDPYVT